MTPVKNRCFCYESYFKRITFYMEKKFLGAEMKKAVSYTHLDVYKRQVHLVEPKSIIRSEGKAVRVIDRRELYNK